MTVQGEHRRRRRATACGGGGAGGPPPGWDPIQTVSDDRRSAVAFDARADGSAVTSRERRGGRCRRRWRPNSPRRGGLPAALDQAFNAARCLRGSRPADRVPARRAYSDVSGRNLQPGYAMLERRYFGGFVPRFVRIRLLPEADGDPLPAYRANPRVDVAAPGSPEEESA